MSEGITHHPAAQADVWIRLTVTVIPGAMGWPKQFIDVGSRRVAVVRMGATNRILIDGRVWQYEQFPIYQQLVEQLGSSDTDRPQPAEAATHVETEDDAE